MNTRILRKKLGMTQVEFAAYLGTNRMTIYNWESGKCPAYIDKLAEMVLNKGYTNAQRIEMAAYIDKLAEMV